MASDFATRVAFLRERGIIGKRASDRAGLSTQDIFRLSREAGFDGGFQGQGISSKTGRRAVAETEIVTYSKNAGLIRSKF